MYNPNQGGSLRNLIICIIVIVLYLILMPVQGNFTYIIFTDYPVLYMILVYGGITLFCIIGVIWRPNFRRSRHKQPEEEQEQREEEQREHAEEPRWTLRY